MHDKIHQAVYSLLSPYEARHLHLKIGSLALLSTTDEEFDNMLFFIVDQLNKGAALIKYENMKIELSNLNLQAAHKAIKSSAYGPATEYLRTGLEYIGEFCWENQYDLSLELFTSLLECLCCTGNYDEIEVLVEEVFEHATCFLDKQRAHACLIKYLTQQGRFQEAIDVGFDGLAQVGEVFPSSISTTVIVINLIKTRFMLFGKTDRYLSNLPPMVNKNKLAAMKIMIDLTAATVFVNNPQYFPVLIMRLLKLSLKYGSCNETVNAYSTYGLVLGTGLGQYRKAYRFGQLALDLARKLETKEWLVHVHLVVYSSIFHWIMHVDKTIEPLRYAQRIGMEAGAVEYAGYSATTICIHSFVKGDDLIALEADMQIYTQQMLEYSIKIPLKNLSPFHQCVLNLMGRSINPALLNGTIIKEETQVELMKEESNRVAELNIYVNGMYLAYLFGDYKRAGQFVDKMGDGVVGSQIEEVVRVFFYGLTSFALAKTTDNKKWTIRAMSSLKKIKKWCSYNESNFLQKLLMLKAEKAVLNKRYDKAEIYYCQAIASAAKHGFLNDEALAYERHGMYLFEKGDLNAAADRLASAERLYMKWGAQAKVKHLRELIPHETTSALYL
jgi:predicted ATPase